MSRRRITVERRGSQVRVCIEGIEHRLSVPAFVELMQHCVPVLQVLIADGEVSEEETS